MNDKIKEISNELMNAQTSIARAFQLLLEISQQNMSLSKTDNLSQTSLNDLHKQSWFDRIISALNHLKARSTAREIANVIAPHIDETATAIISRVHTFCSTMRQKGLLTFHPAYDGSKRGTYGLPAWTLNDQPGPGKEEDYEEKKTAPELLDKFKAWLPLNGVRAADETYIARIRMFENGVNQSLHQLISTLGAEEIIDTFITTDRFSHLSPGTLNDIASTVRKFEQFLTLQSNHNKN